MCAVCVPICCVLGYRADVMYRFCAMTAESVQTAAFILKISLNLTVSEVSYFYMCILRTGRLYDSSCVEP